MRINTHCLTGNTSVSLFWEEKFQILIRVVQLYSFFFLTYYEFWPQQTRDEFTGVFSVLILSFKILY